VALEIVFVLCQQRMSFMVSSRVGFALAPTLDHTLDYTLAPPLAPTPDHTLDYTLDHTLASPLDTALDHTLDPALGLLLVLILGSFARTWS
jgi:hypothetical protein